MIYQCFIFTVWGKNSSVSFVYDIHIFNVFTRICHFFFNKMHYFNIRKSINIIFFGKCSYVLSASLLAFTQQVLWYITSIAGASLAADITQKKKKKPLLESFWPEKSFCQPFSKIYLFSIWHIMHSLLLYGSDCDLLNIGYFHFRTNYLV